MSLIFRLNVIVSIAVAIAVVTSFITAVLLGFTGHGVPATLLAAAGLLPAAVYRPMTQINRAFVLAERTDWFMLSTRDRLRAADSVKGKDARTAALMNAWTDVLADLSALTEAYSSEEGLLTRSIARLLDRH